MHTNPTAYGLTNFNSTANPTAYGLTNFNSTANPTAYGLTTSHDFNHNNFLRQCRDVMTSAGLIAPDYLVTDGSLQRCATVGKEFGKDGAYKIHLNTSTASGAASGMSTLWWKNYRTGASDTFTNVQTSPLTSETAAERKAQFERMEADRLRRHEEQEARYAEVSHTAQELWQNYSPADIDHLYLFNKNVPSYGLKMTHDERLVLSISDENRDIISLQYINKDGSKRFLTGGKKAGGFFAILAEDGNKQGPICICEGYATAASVHMATGYACLVAFDAGNLLPVATMLRKKCPNRSIILCADNDVKSVVSSVKSVQGVESVGSGVINVKGVESVVNGVGLGVKSVNGVVDSVGLGVKSVDSVVDGVGLGVESVNSSAINVGVVKATAAARAINGLLAIPPAHEGKATDFNDLHMWRGLEAVRVVVDAADYVPEDMPEGGFAKSEISGLPLSTNSTNSTKIKNVENVENVEEGERQKPMPLRREPEAQAEYPLEALGVYGEAVAAIAEHVGAPVPMVANSVLGMLSLSAQSIANVEHEGRSTIISLYLLSILSSGDRKSTVDSIVMQAVREHENTLSMQYNEDLKAWAIDNHAYEITKKNISKGKDYKLVREELLELGDAPERPVSPCLIVSNLNIEGLYRLFQEGITSLGLVTDEGGILFGGTAFSSENKLKSTATFSSLWSSGSSDKLRMGEGLSRVQGKRLSCHIMVQPIVAEPLFTDPILQEQGFLPRFLLTWPESLKGTRLKTEVIQEDIRLHPAVIAMYNDCRKLLKYKEMHDTKDSNGIHIFDTLTLSQEAAQIYCSLYNATEREQDKRGELYEVSNYASRCGEQALRLAGVLSLTKDPKNRVIDADTMENAARLALWYLWEAKRIMECSGVNPEILQAEKLLSWLKKEGTNVVSQRTMVQYGPLNDGTRVKKALQLLQENGYVRSLSLAVIDGKKCRTAWEVLCHD